MQSVVLSLAFMVAGTFAAYTVDLRPYNSTALHMFLVNDKNEDLILSKEEFDNVFHVYDYNGDNVIERHEYVCMITECNEDMAYISHAIYDAYDSDHDHRLDQHDFDIFYNKMDADGDGEVDVHEFVAYWVQLLEDTEHHSLHGHPHPHHHDKYCEHHGHHNPHNPHSEN